VKDTDVHWPDGSGVVVAVEAAAGPAGTMPVAVVVLSGDAGRSTVRGHPEPLMLEIR
jgi:hypothetical protein